MTTCGFRFNTTYTDLPKQFFTKLRPESVSQPAIVILNEALASSLDLDFSKLSKTEQSELFSGNQLPEDSSPFSQAYAGHQFGHFTLLGDGRAHVLGEHVTSSDERLDIQFKGSGRTPYSRRGDGKAALGPMLREYLISEAMHHLGIPTTRSLAVVTTGEPVMREKTLLGAILTRVASSHIRVGTFEFAAYRGDQEALKALFDYTVQRHYPDLIESENKALAFIQAVMEKQADLIVQWMRVGFIHGVMNTDNMALSGETIDYGPCAFMDTYDPDTVFSSIDHMGRYAYANQPKIAQWNLARLAESLLPFIDDDPNRAIEQAEHELHRFSKLYHEKWLAMMRSKLGLFGSSSEDQSLVSDLLSWMHKNHVDYTTVFRELTQRQVPTGKLYTQEAFHDWHRRWKERLKKNGESWESSLDVMRHSNPAVIPRNHTVEEALEAALTGNLKPFTQLLNVLREPYQERDGITAYQSPPPPDERVYQTFCGT